MSKRPREEDDEVFVKQSKYAKLMQEIDQFEGESEESSDDPELMENFLTVHSQLLKGLSKYWQPLIDI
jgi:hypothetical protein